MLISEAYRAQNVQLHVERPDYGTSGAKAAGLVDATLRRFGCRSLLDYGCGKQLLVAALRLPAAIEVQQYDPAIPGLEADPLPADCVACTDVLEHVEPDCLDAVLDHLRSLALRCVVLLVATREAKKTLPDGRNAHLLVRPMAWWLPQLMARWDVFMLQAGNGYFMAVMVPKGAQLP